MDVLLLMSTLRICPGLKLSFEHRSALNNSFLSAYLCWDSRLSLRVMDQNFTFGGTIGFGTRTWSSLFLTSKYLDYMQSYMTLLE